MPRAPFQVLVFPFVTGADGEPRYAIFRRRDAPSMWQAISGGGEGSETPGEAAARETFEETGIADAEHWICLDARASIPVSGFGGTEHWPDDLFVIPEHAFGVAVTDDSVQLSAEHTECAWLSFQDAHRRLTWDSNKVALWELHCRVCGLSPRHTPDPALADHGSPSSGRE